MREKLNELQITDLMGLFFYPMSGFVSYQKFILGLHWLSGVSLGAFVLAFVLLAMKIFSDSESKKAKLDKFNFLAFFAGITALTVQNLLGDIKPLDIASILVFIFFGTFIVRQFIGKKRNTEGF